MKYTIFYKIHYISTKTLIFYKNHLPTDLPSEWVDLGLYRGSFQFIVGRLRVSPIWYALMGLLCYICRYDTHTST